MRSGRKRWKARTQAGQFNLNHVWHARPDFPAIFANSAIAAL